MPNIINMKLPPQIEEAIDKNMCFLSMNQLCYVGDVFSLQIHSKQKYYKVIDIWSSPKDFVLKFLWRMCGATTQDQLKSDLENGEYKDTSILYAHMYKRVPWNEIKNMVVQ